MFGTTQMSLDSPKKTSTVECFMKGMRRSVVDHRKFQEAKEQWQRWDRHLLQSTASAQGVENIFYPSYVPSTDEEKKLFVEQQRFGCQVFEQTMHKVCAPSYKTGTHIPRWQLHDSDLTHCMEEGTCFIPHSLEEQGHGWTW
jgi:hypothetical protein